MKLPAKLIDLFGRWSRQRESDLFNHATVPEEEKVTEAMAKKIVDDARKHRLSVDREFGEQDEG